MKHVTVPRKGVTAKQRTEKDANKKTQQGCKQTP